MAAGKNIRAFLAIEPSAEILAALARLQEKLKWEISGAISWTRPQGNHLTLKFLGDIDPAAVDDLGAAVRKRAATVPPLLIKIEKMGVFPDWRKPRVLWAGTAGDKDKLTVLQNKLEEDLAALGFPMENRPFHAHLTLGRIKDAQAAAGIAAALQKHGDFSAGVFRAQELILFQSRLTPQAAIYTKLATFPLAGKESF